MTVLSDDFAAFVADMEASVPFGKWKHDNPGEAAQWATLRTSLLIGQPPATLPLLATRFGKALVDIGRLYVDAQPVVTPPPSVSGPYSALTQAAADALAGKNLQLKTAGQGIAAAPTAGKVTLRCTVEMIADGTVIADNIILKRDPRHTLSGMVAVSGDNTRVACEIDGSSMKCQGVQLGTLVSTITNPDTSGLYVHDIVEGSFVSPQYHGVYCSSCDGWVGDNMKFERISGWGIQFNGNAKGSPVNSNVARVTADHCWGGVVYWDGAANNAVSKALLMHLGAAGPVSGKTLSLNPKADFVTVPTAGYGFS